MSESRVLVKRGYGSTTYASFSEALVFGLLTFWVFTILKFLRLVRDHQRDRWSELGRGIQAGPNSEESKVSLGFSLLPKQPFIAASLFSLSGFLVLIWFTQWIVLGYGFSGTVDDPFKTYYGIAMFEVALSSFLFYVATVITFNWANKTIQKHEFGEQFLRQGGQSLHEYLLVTPDDDMTRRWEGIAQRTTLFLLAALPLVFSPTYGAHLVLTRQWGDYPTMLVVVCFVAAAIFHLWGTALLTRLFNSHLAFERDQLPTVSEQVRQANMLGQYSPVNPPHQDRTENAPKRCLAAIMLTDMVGYSKAMEADEHGTYQRLLQHNKIIRAAIAACNGREVKTIGDAFLALFPSARDSWDCAIAIQEAFMAFNARQAEHEPTLVRIGLHLGDVLVTDNDVFGDGVNVAARIEPLAEPGGICVSEEVYMMIRKRVELRVEQLDNPELKNISAAPRVYRVALKTDRERA